jgi:hypothetical protein
MKYFFILLLSSVFFSCEDLSQKTDTEKAEGNSGLHIKTDSAEVKIGSDGISVQSTENGKDSVNIKINSTDGIKIEGKDGKVEINTGDGGSININKKGQNVNIKVKGSEN